MLRAWKKLIWDGSRPVGPAGQVKSMGASEPTLAYVGILFASILFFNSKKDASVKISPTLSFNCGIRDFS